MPCVARESFALHNIFRGEVVRLSQGEDGTSTHLHRRRRQPENAPVKAGSDSENEKVTEFRMFPHASSAEQIIITM